MLKKFPRCISTGSCSSSLDLPYTVVFIQSSVKRMLFSPLPAISNCTRAEMRIVRRP